MADWTASKTYQKHDDYMTPSYAWEWVKDYIPKDKQIWEAFYGDGTSGTHLTNLGFQVIHENIDFYQHDKGDIVVSNPPFSDAKNVLTRLKTINKPFMLIMPSAKITTKYFSELFKDERIQIIIPRKRINFVKMENGNVVMDAAQSRCSFDCFYYCWQMGLPKDIMFL